MTAVVPISRDPVVAQHCEALLATLLADAHGVLGAVMASVDGHAFAKSFQAGHEQEATRIAAICSSVLALSESFSHETLQGKVSFNCVSTSHGSIMTVRIPSRQNVFVLCVWADKSDNFAMALRFTLDAAHKLAALVDDSP